MEIQEIEFDMNVPVSYLYNTVAIAVGLIIAVIVNAGIIVWDARNANTENADKLQARDARIQVLEASDKLKDIQLAAMAGKLSAQHLEWNAAVTSLFGVNRDVTPQDLRREFEEICVLHPKRTGCEGVKPGQKPRTYIAIVAESEKRAN